MFPLDPFRGILHFRSRSHRFTAIQYRQEMPSRFAIWNEVVGLPTAACPRPHRIADLATTAGHQTADYDALCRVKGYFSTSRSETVVGTSGLASTGAG